MAPKRPTLVHEAPASLEEEETTSSSEEEEEGESSPEPKRSSPQSTQSLKAKKPDATDESESDSGTESESDSGTESESESDDLHPVPRKPIASKPIEEASTKRTKSKLKSALEKASSKRLKTKDSDNGALEKPEGPKKQLFQRLWSEDDEVVLLKGIIAVTEEKGIDYVKDMNAVLDFIKNSLHFSVNLNQLRDKVGRLKKKFKNQVCKGKEGENKMFSKQHEQTLFNLSKKIWGSEIKSKVKPKTESREVGIERENGWDKRGMVEIGRGVRMEDYVMERGLDHVADEGKKSEMEEKWRKLHVAELELFVKRKELIAEQGKLLLDAFKRSV